MDSVHGLLQGLSVALRPGNLFAALVGAVLGTLVGALPGLGTTSTIAILLPLTIRMDPVAALICFAAIYNGAMYGGSITSILVRVPGESSSVMTALEGYELARKGRAGAALGMTAIASWVAGTLGAIVLLMIAKPMAELGLRFGPPEYFSLMLLGLTLVAWLGGKDLIKAAASVVLGLLLATIGVDPIEGQARFTMGLVELMDGIDFVVVAMGVFALGEILTQLAAQEEQAQYLRVRWRDLYPTLGEILRHKWVMLRASVVGFFIGVLPGAGATIASFVAYALERAIGKNRSEFGRGAMAGVVAPEAANNAATAGALAPMLALGVPGSGATAVMLAALTLYGLRPGPLLMQTNPDLFWGVIASLLVANMILIVLNLPLAPAFASLVRVPFRYQYPFITLITLVGVYSLRNSTFDMALVVLFGLLGYAMRKLEVPAAPMLLSLVLAPILERSLNQSLTISHGSLSIFVLRPLSLGLLVIAVLIIVAAARGTIVRGPLQDRSREASAAGSVLPSPAAVSRKREE